MCGMMIGVDGGDDRPEVLLFFFCVPGVWNREEKPCKRVKMWRL